MDGAPRWGDLSNLGERVLKTLDRAAVLAGTVPMAQIVGRDYVAAPLAGLVRVDAEDGVYTTSKVCEVAKQVMQLHPVGRDVQPLPQYRTAQSHTPYGVWMLAHRQRGTAEAFVGISYDNEDAEARLLLALGTRGKDEENDWDALASAALTAGHILLDLYCTEHGVGVSVTRVFLCGPGLHDAVRAPAVGKVAGAAGFELEARSGLLHYVRRIRFGGFTVRLYSLKASASHRFQRVFSRGVDGKPCRAVVAPRAEAGKGVLELAVAVSKPVGADFSEMLLEASTLARRSGMEDLVLTSGEEPLACNAPPWEGARHTPLRPYLVWLRSPWQTSGTTESADTTSLTPFFFCLRYMPPGRPLKASSTAVLTVFQVPVGSNPRPEELLRFLGITPQLPGQGAFGWRMEFAGSYSPRCSIGHSMDSRPAQSFRDLFDATAAEHLARYGADGLAAAVRHPHVLCIEDSLSVVTGARPEDNSSPPQPEAPVSTGRARELGVVGMPRGAPAWQRWSRLQVPRCLVEFNGDASAPSMPPPRAAPVALERSRETTRGVTRPFRCILGAPASAIDGHDILDAYVPFCHRHALLDMQDSVALATVRETTLATDSILRELPHRLGARGVPWSIIIVDLRRPAPQKGSVPVTTLLGNEEDGVLCVNPLMTTGKCDSQGVRAEMMESMALGRALLWETARYLAGDRRYKAVAVVDMMKILLEALVQKYGERRRTRLTQQEAYVDSQWPSNAEKSLPGLPAALWEPGSSSEPDDDATKEDRDALARMVAWVHETRDMCPASLQKEVAAALTRRTDVLKEMAAARVRSESMNTCAGMALGMPILTRIGATVSGECVQESNRDSVPRDFCGDALYSMDDFTMA